MSNSLSKDYPTTANAAKLLPQCRSSAYLLSELSYSLHAEFVEYMYYPPIITNDRRTPNHLVYKSTLLTKILMDTQLPRTLLINYYKGDKTTRPFGWLSCLHKQGVLTLSFTRLRKSSVHLRGVGGGAPPRIKQRPKTKNILDATPCRRISRRRCTKLAKLGRRRNKIKDEGCWAGWEKEREDSLLVSSVEIHSTCRKPFHPSHIITTYWASHKTSRTKSAPKRKNTGLGGGLHPRSHLLLTLAVDPDRPDGSIQPVPIPSLSLVVL